MGVDTETCVHLMMPLNHLTIELLFAETQWITSFLELLQTFILHICETMDVRYFDCLYLYGI